MTDRLITSETVEVVDRVLDEYCATRGLPAHHPPAVIREALSAALPHLIADLAKDAAVVERAAEAVEKARRSTAFVSSHYIAYEALRALQATIPGEGDDA